MSFSHRLEFFPTRVTCHAEIPNCGVRHKLSPCPLAFTHRCISGVPAHHHHLIPQHCPQLVLRWTRTTCCSLIRSLLLAVRKPPRTSEPTRTSCWHKRTSAWQQCCHRNGSRWQYLLGEGSGQLHSSQRAYNPDHG